MYGYIIEKEKFDGETFYLNSGYSWTIVPKSFKIFSSVNRAKKSFAYDWYLTRLKDKDNTLDYKLRIRGIDLKLTEKIIEENTSIE